MSKFLGRRKNIEIDNATIMLPTLTWEDVSNHLDSIENRNSYYVGGTLCIDDIGMAFNRNGTFFSYNDKFTIEGNTMPTYTRNKINFIYQKYKKNRKDGN